MNQHHLGELPLGELVKDTQRVLGTPALNATLHYCSPVHGGWGVVRTALLVPESYLLFVCPSACGRHGAIAAIEQGFKDRVGYLCIDEREIVLGDYEAAIMKGAREAMRRVTPRPSALLICVSCLDDLLGTDHTTSIAELEEDLGIPVRLARMNPIHTDGQLPPTQRIQRTMLEFVSRSQVRDQGVNLLGCFVPPGPSSELARFLKAHGHGPLRHPGLFSDFQSLQDMGRSACALVIRPEGNAAATYSYDQMGIQSLSIPVAFDESTILTRYQKLADFLKELTPNKAPAPGKLLSCERERCKSSLERLTKRLQGARVALDATATASPFSLALALTEGGIAIHSIYTERVPLHELESFHRLAALNPRLLVRNPTHATRHDDRPDLPEAELAIGFTAAFSTRAQVSVPAAFDEGAYGFEALERVVSLIEQSLDAGASSLEQQVRDYGLVV